MILNLYVENYVIIEKVSLDFRPGFSCFTGETGAGKSLIVDALGILLGNRFTTDLIRKNCDSCQIEASIKIEDEKIITELAEAGYESAEIYVFSRKLTSDNRAYAKINGKVCTQTFMKALLSQLIDIHSQHDNQYLLNKKYHLALLDRYIDSPLLAEIQEKYDMYYQLDRRFKDLKEKKYSASELEFLEYQVKEIDDLALKVGEIEELESRFKTISQYEKSATKIEEAINILDNNHLKENLWQLIKDLESVNEEEISTITNRFKEAYFALEEGSGQIRDFRKRIDFTEAEINQIQSRLYEIKKIQRKFGDSYEIIQKKRQEMLVAIEEINNSEELLNKLENEVQLALASFMTVALEYRTIRKEKALQLVSAIKSNLEDLDLPNSAFEVVFLEKEPAVDGIDDIEFLLSTNKNVDLRPLAKVASGGELSRIMLGLKCIFTALQGISTIVFDEIDTGVSGTTAFSTGMKMQQLGRAIQVLSVTHLAQVSACAKNHYYVNKLVIKDQTTTVVNSLSEEEIIQQLAVLGFGMINDDSLNAAKLLYQEGQRSFHE